MVNVTVQPPPEPVKPPSPGVTIELSGEEADQLKTLLDRVFVKDTLNLAGVHYEPSIFRRLGSVSSGLLQGLEDAGVGGVE
jgi:hypothetical protein